MTTPTTRLALSIALAATLASSGCNLDHRHRSGPVETEHRSVQLGNAKSVQVEVHMGAGELKLGSGASDLLDGDFTYERSGKDLEIDYRVSGDRGILSVRQPAGEMVDIRLKNGVPMDLEVELGAGKSELTVGSLELRKLDVRVGVGECTVDLAGDWKENMKATIKGGIGKTTVLLPEDVGVRVRAHGGIGEIRRGPLEQKGDVFVNETYGKSPVTLDVEVAGGIGEINLEFSEGPPVI